MVKVVDHTRVHYRFTPNGLTYTMGRQPRIYIKTQIRAPCSAAHEDRGDRRDRARRVQPERARVARVRRGRGADRRVDVREVTDVQHDRRGPREEAQVLVGHGAAAGGLARRAPARLRLGVGRARAAPPARRRRAGGGRRLARLVDLGPAAQRAAVERKVRHAAVVLAHLRVRVHKGAQDAHARMQARVEELLVAHEPARERLHPQHMDEQPPPDRRVAPVLDRRAREEARKHAPKRDVVGLAGVRGRRGQRVVERTRFGHRLAAVLHLATDVRKRPRHRPQLAREVEDELVESRRARAGSQRNVPPVP